MGDLTVSTVTLREKANLIRTLLEENKMNHQYLWSQITAQVGALPRDIAATHFHVNHPWHEAIRDHYENYQQIASNMHMAADEYQDSDQDVATSFE